LNDGPEVQMQLPIIIQQSREAASRVAMSARPDAAVVPAPATTVKPQGPHSARQALASLLRRSADRLSPVAE
jgi:hypothetical protein